LTISESGVVRGISLASWRMMSETLSVEIPVASGVLSQTMPADRRLET